MKGVCRYCLRSVPAELVRGHPFGNVRLSDHYVYEGLARKLCPGSGKMARPSKLSS